MQLVTDRPVDPIAALASSADRQGADVLYLALAGIGCPHCAKCVRNALLGAAGVVDVDVDHSAALATVWYDRNRAGVTTFVDVVADAGRGTHHRFLAVPVELPHVRKSVVTESE